jgi:hypothetical protein
VCYFVAGDCGEWAQSVGGAGGDVHCTPEAVEGEKTQFRGFEISIMTVF